ncbi:hypothetical protein Rsub_07933 [Raphidocelis subcapitata]|uniref:Yos1-like protein n=1 Tax=Raphidocelis subcapitata TaxID=307507 RepID=A0A2V0P5T2_9CHLO|nr:hypothetical protein Rsub_07933 [Raphidocelis subcapitata]|eukprot:GBF95218.1 hypothetical protein Rsub_07933 [Raphidocelis subcapitata]
MTLFTLLQSILMLVNGVAILNNDRFLEKYGWGYSQMHSTNSLKMSIIGAFHAATYFRAFLLPINAVIIIIKLLAG